jgi:hypothetical protein
MEILTWRMHLAGDARIVCLGEDERHGVTWVNPECWHPWAAWQLLRDLQRRGHPHVACPPVGERVARAGGGASSFPPLDPITTERRRPAPGEAGVSAQRACHGSPPSERGLSRPG